MNIENSPTLAKYKDTMKEILGLYYPMYSLSFLDEVIDNHIKNQFKDSSAEIRNSYTKKNTETTLLAISDFIDKKTPTCTAMGTLFKQHDKERNLMFETMQSFLDLRKLHKKEMFKYPKGSALFDKFNLLQLLDKIDANGSYGCIGQYSSLLYNVYVASSITSQGRAYISSASLFFEAFIADNVKFGSLNEVLEFINHIVSEKDDRRFSDKGILDRNIEPEDCLIKVYFECGYNWQPTEEEIDIIWQVIRNLNQEDINRIYYKNNLLEFIDNKVVMNLITTILKKLKSPLLNSLDIPEEIQPDIKLLGDIVIEYVYYRYMFIDRTDRCGNMMKAVIGVSDTDSAIVCLDSWYKHIAEKISGQYFTIANYAQNPIYEPEKGKRIPIRELPKKYNFDFINNKIVDKKFSIKPLKLHPDANMKYSIINILAYIMDRAVNDYMCKVCENCHSLQIKQKVYTDISEEEFKLGMSYSIQDVAIFKFDKYTGKPKPNWSLEYNRNCMMILKNEFTMNRVLLTAGKKHYASLQSVQEGNIVPYDKQVDIKGIDILLKSTAPEMTRKALKKILEEDILRADEISQLRIIQDIAIYEKTLMDSIKSGNRTFYKPATIKSINSYENPMRIQGIKASIVWNNIKPDDYPSINLEDRNAISIAKVKLNKSNADKIANKYPDVYNNIISTLNLPEFNGTIDSIGIPLDIIVPEWITEFIDYDTILLDNIKGFPFESVGCMRMDRVNITYTNMLQL